jgi:putative CocE/NonD family hydrolase
MAGMNVRSGSSILLLCALFALAEEPKVDKEWIQANYTKYEYRIPMRDGARLFTAVYSPKEMSRTYPVLLLRTPYSIRPYGPDQFRDSLGPSDRFAREGYIFVYQDVRGRFMSEGEYLQIRPHKPDKRGPKDIDESTDTWDSIDWLLKNVRGHNGKAGIWGISYPGFYTSMGIIDAHPALAAASPQAPVTDWFIGDDFHHNGAFYLAHAFRWFWRNGRVFTEPSTKAPPETFEFDTPDGYDFFLRLGPLSQVDEKLLKGMVPFWGDMARHGSYDEFWKQRDVRPHLKKIRPAVMVVGGWFDAEDLFGALETYRHIEKNSPGAYNILVMGPWYHGQWDRGRVGKSLGHVRFLADTSEFYREQILFPFFEHFLRGKAEPKLPEAFVFETGANQWRRFDAWPPAGVRTRTLYLHANGTLRFDAAPRESAEAFDEYVSDPFKPVPFIPNIATQMTREHMLDDQRFAATRPDVLVYQTEPLEADVTLAGPLSAVLHVSTTGTDSDWVVKLIDVYPGDFPDLDPNPAEVKMGGYQQLIRGEPFRGKFRKSFEKPEPFTPGRPDRIDFTLPDVFHTFRSGHRIMVQIQSSWFPLVDRNPQKFVDIYNARAEDFQKATQRVYRHAGRASGFRVSVWTP